jgi:hypothetical protein
MSTSPSDTSKDLHQILLRKELVHRFITYYTLLQREEKKEYVDNHRRPFPTVDFDPMVTYNQFDDELKFYENMITRRAKIEELRTLMKIELQMIRDGMSLDPNNKQFQKSQQGYPSFMQPWSGANHTQTTFTYVPPGRDYTVAGGPSEFRLFLNEILEKLVAGRETPEDLQHLDSFLLNIYTKKTSVTSVRNETEHEQMDFHQRMTKEIRRKQYAVGVRSGSRSPDRLLCSMSPTAIHRANPIIPVKSADESQIWKTFTKQKTGGEGMRQRMVEKDNRETFRPETEECLENSELLMNKKRLNQGILRDAPVNHTNYLTESIMTSGKKTPSGPKAPYEDNYKGYGSASKWEMLRTPSRIGQSSDKKNLGYSGMSSSRKQGDRSHDKYEVLPTPAQSPNDKRKYALIKLKANNMHVLLVSDPETEMSSNAVKVNVGSFEDPPEFLGLAHFLEHMLFLGTERFPDPAEFDNFFSENGGYNNAYTADTETVYSFETSNDALYEGMDRLADFFKKPLFLEQYTDKEIGAINSEFEMRVSNPIMRYYRIIEHCSNP